MATDPKTVAYLADQMAGAGEVSARKMFGEYGVYVDGKLAGLVCDDRLFVKPTEASDGLLAGGETDAPYPGAKPHPVVPEDRWDDADWLAALMRGTAAALPAPKPKTPKAKKAAKKKATP